MRVRLLAFASAREAVGSAESEVELPDGADLGALRRELAGAHPALAELWPRLALAVDGRVSGDETPLSDGCEVALLPPVSGGAPVYAEITEEPLDPGALLARLAHPARGARALFVGSVRDRHAGRTVTSIDYEAYRPMALAALERIAGELVAAEAELELAVAHRIGHLAAGETSIVIAAASPHREAAFTAVRAALERIKREVPIWKREQYADGSWVWREEEPLGGAQSVAAESAATRSSR